LKKNEVCLLSQTSNFHPNKKKYKSEKETLYFYYTKNNKNRKHIKLKNKKVNLKKKLKHEPSLKKPGDFTVAGGSSRGALCTGFTLV
jgi:hypothetical protein